MRRQLGKTGIELFPIGLGAMPLSIADRPNTSQAISVIHAALDAGVDFIDTANVYCLDDNDIGHNEKLIARAVASWSGKKAIYVATKGGLCRPLGSWEVLGHPRALRSACEQSLRDLNVEQIFLYQLHAPDPSVPFTDQIATLATLKEEGKIKHIGLSNVDAQQIEAAQRIVRIESIQNRWNPLEREDANNGVFDACRRYEMTYIAYSPVGGGRGHQELANSKVLQELAKKYQASPYQIMLAWSLAAARFVVPIPGASRVASITDSVKAASLQLLSSDLAAIDQHW